MNETRRAWALLLPLLGLLGCVGGASDLEPVGGDEVAETSTALSGSTVTTRMGVVSLNGAYCTGVMISPQVILTAGHCVDQELPAGSKSGLVNTIQVQYKFPDGKTRCVSAPDSNGDCLGPTPLHVTIWPDYTNLKTHWQLTPEADALPGHGMTDSNPRSEASAGVSYDAIGGCHAPVRLEFALTI